MVERLRTQSYRNRNGRLGRKDSTFSTQTPVSTAGKRLGQVRVRSICTQSDTVDQFPTRNQNVSAVAMTLRGVAAARSYVAITTAPGVDLSVVSTSINGVTFAADNAVT